MSKDFTFRSALEATIGHSTKKTAYDQAVENTNELDQRLEGLAFLGAFLPKAGTGAVAYDGSNRVSTITYATSPVGVVTFVYDDGNGGRVDYVEFVCTDPVAKTIRITFSYDGSNNITGWARTLP
ncbi:hypothetical protein ES705_46543 [subsurface metagenome]